MPKVPEREYRKAQPFQPSGDEYIVEGYASTFEPYVLWSWDGVDYIEQIDRHAFDACDMSDVIMQYDHEGRVFARQSNGSLELTVDDKGLRVKADLSRSSRARDLYEDIAAELITQMSFAFTVEESAYNEKTHTRTITKIAKLYDVSAVSIPANPTTELSVSSRSWLDGVIEAERLEKEARARKIKILKLLAEEV